MVWALPRSLATTWGIEIFRLALTNKFANISLKIVSSFYSSGYLDVSVPQVAFNDLFIQSKISCFYWQDGLPHSEISGSKVACHLTEAYRRLLRPSSSFIVKASTIHPFVKLQSLKHKIFLYVLVLFL